jgi:hypothetical protein
MCQEHPTVVNQVPGKAINILAYSNKTRSGQLNTCSPVGRGPIQLENPMLRQAQSSFFYVILAEICFRRAVGTRHPEGSDALRKIGRSYLENAKTVTSALESLPAKFHRSATRVCATSLRNLQLGRDNRKPFRYSV